MILVTGADGYLGSRIARRLLTDTDDRVVLTVRAADRAELARKRGRLLAELGKAAGGAAGKAAQAPGRVELVAADLRDAEPFGDLDASGLTCVVHAAARTAFNVTRSDAHQVNVAGTERVADFARRCPRLDRLLVLSTLFTAGDRCGRVDETGHEPTTGFVNFYEWSKFEAEHLLRTRYADLPLTIARLATVVADDDGGTVTQYNAFHNTLKLFFYGLLSLMPGDPATGLYLATGEFTSRGVVRLAAPGTPCGIYHVAPDPAHAIALGEAIDTAFAVFEGDAGYRRRRLLRPEFCDVDSFRELVRATRGFGASPTRQAIDSVAPFAEQMFLAKEFHNGRLRAAWPGYAVPQPRRLVEAVCTQLVRTRWGRTTAGQRAAERQRRQGEPE
jgi:nucleoside-diphosphate-sugar epimerase